MTVLLVQTFLLLLGAFLLGASLACLIRRGISGRREVVEPAASPALTGAVAAPAVPAAPAPSAIDTDRFGRALAGGHGAAVPPVFQPGQPVVEVQPLPERRSVAVAAPPPAPAAPEFEPEPVSVPVFDPEPAPEPVHAAPPPAEPASLPVPPANPDRSFAAAPPRRDVGASYTAIAVAAAAAAAAAKAKAEADAAQAEQAAAEADALAHAREAEVEAPVAVDGDDEEAALVEPDAPLDVPALSPVPSASGLVDDLMRIRGIDAALKDRLHALGVHSFSVIAAWSAPDVARISRSLGLDGRIEQENWIEQAQILARGGDTDYSRRRAAGAPPEAMASVDGDRLHRIIGVDPESEALLRANGVLRLEDIAAWTDADVAYFEDVLGMPGRIGREGWVTQARILTGGAASGARAASEAVGSAARERPAGVIAAAVTAGAAVDALSATAQPAPSRFSPEIVREAVAETEFDALSEPPAEPDSAPAVGSYGGGRSEGYAGLRSVRSEALRGDGASLAYSSSDDVEDLKRIRGIGVLIEKKLHSLGITTYEQVANWTGADVDRISQLLDFKGRIERENWIEQARILASGGQTEFSRRADRGDI